MEYTPGCLAKSLAGHDKDQYFVILSVEGEYVTLADGRLRTVTKPKKKKKKHIQATAHKLAVSFPPRDEEIRKELKNYVNNHCKKEV